MKKIYITLSVLGIAQLSMAQTEFTPQYVEELTQYSGGSGNLSGTARYKGLSGAMGALGGDLSATYKNPASGAVFLGSEAVITAGIHNASTELDNGDKHSESEFRLDQVGAVMVIDGLSSNDWKNFALGINYQEQDYVNERIDYNLEIASNYNNTSLDGLYSEKYGTSSVTNFTFSSNYRDKIYVGGGLNFHTFDTESLEAVSLYEPDFLSSYTYGKDYSPNARTGQGVSVGFGLIGRVNQQLRLGAAYQSPTWYRDVEEVVTEYAMYTDSDTDGEYYMIDGEYLNFLSDINSGQKFTGSAAWVFGKNGLISMDYTHTDYSSAKYVPKDSYAGENSFISNEMKGANSLNIGAEARFDTFAIRGGYRYEQSPYKKVALQDVNGTYQPFGDLNGFSLGLGYEMNGFFIDAAYDFFSRDRNYLLNGNFYDLNGTAPTDLYTQDEALEILSFNATELGFATSIQDITQKQGNISLSVGFKF